MNVTRFFGYGLLTVSAALLVAETAVAQFSPYQAPQPAANQPYNPQPQGYNVPQGYVPQNYVPRMAMNYQAPAPDGAAAPAVPAAPGAPCNCNPAPVMPAPAPAPAYQTYAPAPCATGACGNGACGVNGYRGDIGYNTYGCGYGAGGRLGGRRQNCGSGGYGGGAGWFGGIYGLLMERDNGPKIPLAFVGDGSMVAGDYPLSDAVILRTRDADIGFQGGFESRIGKWFGGGDCCCSGPRWGVEGVYWGLFEDDAAATYVDSGTLVTPQTARIYSMIDPRGIEYDHGAGYRPARDYWDYAPPVQPDNPAFPADIIRIDLARVRSTFEVHNVEVNLLRIGCGSGCGSGFVAGPRLGGRINGRGYGGDCTGAGCDAGCGGCDAGACCASGPRFSCTGVCGFRYMQFDETFMYGVDFRNTTTAATGFLDYHSDVENDLYGFQLGCRGNYRLGCRGRWGIHFASNVGIYGNDIEVRQYMDSPTGNVRFISTGEDFDVTATKTDVSMVGEVRAGMSYQYSATTRLYGGWRAIGVTGVALANDQAPGAFIDAATLANYINSNGSLILHGLQAGVEWNY